MYLSKGVLALASTGSKPLQSRSHCTQIFPEVDQKWIGGYGRWIEVDPSRFNERRGRCRVELRVSIQPRLAKFAMAATFAG